jgi:hypothetical protein
MSSRFLPGASVSFWSPFASAHGALFAIRNGVIVILASHDDHKETFLPPFLDPVTTGLAVVGFCCS